LILGRSGDGDWLIDRRSRAATGAGRLFGTAAGAARTGGVGAQAARFTAGNTIGSRNHLIHGPDGSPLPVDRSRAVADLDRGREPLARPQQRLRHPGGGDADHPAVPQALRGPQSVQSGGGQPLAAPVRLHRCPRRLRRRSAGCGQRRPAAADRRRAITAPPHRSPPWPLAPLPGTGGRVARRDGTDGTAGRGDDPGTADAASPGPVDRRSGMARAGSTDPRSPGDSHELAGTGAARGSQPSGAADDGGGGAADPAAGAGGDRSDGRGSPPEPGGTGAGPLADADRGGAAAAQPRASLSSRTVWS